MAETGGIRAGKAFVEAYLNDTKLQQGLANAQRRMKAWGASMNAMGTKMMLVAGVAAAPLMLAVQKASAMEETMNKFNVVFGTSAKAVKQWSDEFAGAMGRSKEQIASFMAGSQDLFMPLGFAGDAATDMSKQVTQLSVDLASFNNLVDAAVLRDLHAALTGGGEVMKKYGVIVSEAAVKLELLNMGIDPKTATNQMKVQARLNIIMQGTTAAQGDAERSAGSYANQLKNLKAKVADTAAEIGGALLPAATEILVGLSGVAKTVANWAAENKGLIVTLAHVVALVGAAGAALVALGATAKVLAALIGTVKALHAAALLLTANPLILTFAAAAAAAVILGQALAKPTAELRRMADAAGSALEKGDQLRASHVAQFRRLEELAAKQRLADREMEEAGNIISGLRNYYGELGVSLDQVTGKITGLGDAWEGMTGKMAAHRLNQVSADIADLEAEVAKLAPQLSPGAGAKTDLGTQGLWDLLTEEDPEVVRKKYKALTIRLFDLRKLREELKAGKFTAPEPGGDAGTGAPGGGAGGGGDYLKWLQRVNQVTLQMIDDRQKRELAAIRSKYYFEIEQARAAGKKIQDLENLRAMELGAARKRHAAEEAKEVADHEAGLREEIARTEINASAMTAESKRKALLDLDRKAALAEAQRLGIDPELVMRKYDLLRMGTAGQDALGQAKVSTTGGFSAYGVARGVGGYDIQTRIAKAGEDAAKTLQQLLTEAKNAQLVFG